MCVRKSSPTTVKQAADFTRFTASDYVQKTIDNSKSRRTRGTRDINNRVQESDSVFRFEGIMQWRPCRLREKPVYLQNVICVHRANNAGSLSNAVTYCANCAVQLAKVDPNSGNAKNVGHLREPCLRTTLILAF